MKALIITGKYVTDSEYTFALYYLPSEGVSVDVATLDGQPTAGILGEKVIPTLPGIPDIYTTYDILILPGGAKAMEYLRQSRAVLNYIEAHHRRGGFIGCICHGAQLLISAGLVRGRRISGYYSIKDDITNAGGEFVDAPFVTDGRIVTSPHYRYLGFWMREVLRVANPTYRVDVP